MARYAQARGIPAQDLVQDYAGRRTYDSCYRAGEIFGLDQAVLVTQAFHLPRALLTCDRLGLEVVGVSADRHQYIRSPWYELRERICHGANYSSALAGKTAYGATLNAHRALGIWASYGGGGNQFGTLFQPLDYAPGGPGLINAFLMTPRHGTLNLQAGTISKPLWDAVGAAIEFLGEPLPGEQPIEIRAHGGMVTIGTP